MKIKTTKRLITLIFLAAAAALFDLSAAAGGCTQIVPDFRYRCAGNPIDANYNVVYVDRRDDSVKGANASDPNFPADVILSGSMASDYQWGTQVASASPGLNALLTARAKPNCPAYDPENPENGKTCSYGRTTLWLDTWEPATRTWLHTNLNYFYGYNSEAHGWSTWLHPSRGLFNVLVRPIEVPALTSQTENNPQIYSVDFTSGSIEVAEFAPNQLNDPNCLTGRVSAMPNLEQNSCFDGQRISFVRRCYQGESVNAWWNNTRYDGTGGMCPGIPGGSALVPVLRTHVVELDAMCTPKKSWGSILARGIAPVREPPVDPIYRQMGVGPEWGDMLAAISPDGNYIAVATNKGPSNTADSCAGFQYVLQDVNNPVSGTSARRTHWCQLEKNVWNGQITCATPMVELNPGGFDPPAATPLPTFLPLPAGYSLLFTRNWAQYHDGPYIGITRSFFQASPPQFDIMYFNTPDGNNMQGVQAIYH